MFDNKMQKLLLGVATVCFLGLSSAQAGFLWVPPADDPTPPVVQKPAVEQRVESRPKAPVAQVKPETMPKQVSKPVVQAVPQPTEPTVKKNQIANKRMMAIVDYAAHQKQLDAEAAKQKTQKTVKSASNVLQGFANDVPLVVALEQIIPSDIAFAAHPQVDLSQIVSWRGGADWRVVLHSTLKNIGLSAVERDGIVYIHGLEQNKSPSLPKKPSVPKETSVKPEVISQKDVSKPLVRLPEHIRVQRKPSSKIQKPDLDAAYNPYQRSSAIQTMRAFDLPSFHDQSLESILDDQSKATSELEDILGQDQAGSNGYVDPLSRPLQLDNIPSSPAPRTSDRPVNLLDQTDYSQDPDVQQLMNDYGPQDDILDQL